ncbi:hypothetical protein OUZ56_031314 [Daphnia magna]|uniref:Uncharacterized protein n=1 Tax=Daphnia magna TaxID=35525 RepID=A0ABQ9ZUP9_9CRUS|nr:hypothetical protein OUZ56_031314 [Daphnia magna]
MAASAAKTVLVCDTNGAIKQQPSAYYFVLFLAQEIGKRDSPNASSRPTVRIESYWIVVVQQRPCDNILRLFDEKWNVRMSYCSLEFN